MNVLYKLQISLVLGVLLIMPELFSQSMDYRYIDSLTFDQYNRKDWKNLNKTGNEAIKSGLDYYYLRLRLAKGNYEQRDFSLAHKHFGKALTFNEYNGYSQSYLIGSLLENGCNTEAGFLFTRSHSTAKQYVPIHEGFRFTSVHGDGGMIFRNEMDNIGFNELTGQEGLYGQQRRYDNSNLFDVGGFIQFKPNIMYYIGIQSINTRVTDRFAFIENSLLRDSTAEFDWGSAYYYTVDTTQKMEEFKHDIEQKSLYSQLRWSFSDRLTCILGGQLIGISQTKTTASLENFSVSDTAYFITELDSVAMYNTSLQKVVFNQDTSVNIDWTISLNAQYVFGKVTAKAGACFSQLNEKKTQQFSIGAYYQPFGNPDLYFSAEIVAVHDAKQTNIIAKEIIGMKLFSPFWLDVAFLFGNIENFNDQYSYIVYNNPELIRFSLEPTLIVSVSKHLRCQLRFRMQQADTYYYTYTSTSDNLIQQTTSNYSYSIIGGIKWIF